MFEYNIEYAMDVELPHVLNMQGQSGWELICMNKVAQTNSWMCVFKRSSECATIKELQEIADEMVNTTAQKPKSETTGKSKTRNPL